MKLEFSRRIFEKRWNIKFIKIGRVGAELFYADTRTHKHNEDDSR